MPYCSACYCYMLLGSSNTATILHPQPTPLPWWCAGPPPSPRTAEVSVSLSATAPITDTPLGTDPLQLQGEPPMGADPFYLQGKLPMGTDPWPLQGSPSLGTSAPSSLVTGSFLPTNPLPEVNFAIYCKTLLPTLVSIRLLLCVLSAYFSCTVAIGTSSTCQSQSQ